MSSRNISWVGLEYSNNNKELVSKIKSLNPKTYIENELPRGKVLYEVELHNNNEDVNNLINKVNIEPITLGLELDSKENPSDYIDNMKLLIEKLILADLRIPVTFIDVITYVDPSNSLGLILSFIPYSGSYRIYEKVNFTLSNLKKYRYLTSDPLINYLSPKLEDSEGNKIEIKKFNSIYIIESPMNLTPVERVKFQDSLDIVELELNNLRNKGVFLIYRDIDVDDILDLGIITDIAHMWGMKVTGTDINNERNLLKDNMIVLTCSGNCKHLLDLFPLNFSFYPKLTSTLTAKDQNAIYLPIDPSESIKEWIIRSVKDVKDATFPLIDFYGEWQTYSLNDAPKIMALAIKTYIELFPFYERISDIDVSDDLGIHCRFATIDEFIKYKEKFLPRLDNIHLFDSILTTTWVEAILIRLHLNEPSLVIQFRGKWNVVLSRNITSTELKNIKDEVREQTEQLKDRILSQLPSEFKSSDSFELLIKELQKLHGKEAIHGYHPFGSNNSNGFEFNGHTKMKNMPYIEPNDGKIVVESYDDSEGRIYTVEVELSNGQHIHLFSIADSNKNNANKEKIERYTSMLWNKGWLMSPFGSEVMRTLQRMPSHFGSYGILKHAHESHESGQKGLEYLEDLFNASTNTDNTIII